MLQDELYPRTYAMHHVVDITDSLSKIQFKLYFINSPHKKFLQIYFSTVVYDGVKWYKLVAFDPMENIGPNKSYCCSKVCDVV